MYRQVLFPSWSHLIRKFIDTMTCITIPACSIRASILRPGSTTTNITHGYQAREVEYFYSEHSKIKPLPFGVLLNLDQHVAII